MPTVGVSYYFRKWDCFDWCNNFGLLEWRVPRKGIGLIFPNRDADWAPVPAAAMQANSEALVAALARAVI